MFFNFKPWKPCFFYRLQKYMTPQTLSMFFCYKWKLISTFIFKVFCQMKSHGNAVQFSIFNYKLKNEDWNTGFHSAWPLVRSHWKSYRYFINLSEAHLDLFQSDAHIQQYSILPLIRCHWKLLWRTAGWRTLNSVFINHFKKGCFERLSAGCSYSSVI